MKENQAIRKMARMKGVKHWQIAQYLGISEQTIMRWLRVPLSSEREKIIMEVIKKISTEGS